MRDKIVLHVKGMDCVGCELNVVRTLEDLDGVQKAEASYPEKKAVVQYDGEAIDPQQVPSLIQDRVCRKSIGTISPGGWSSSCSPPRRACIIGAVEEAPSQEFRQEKDPWQ